jgi:hypothetical protein
MKTQRLLVAVTIVNVALVVFALAQTRPALAADAGRHVGARRPLPGDRAAPFDHRARSSVREDQRVGGSLRCKPGRSLGDEEHLRDPGGERQHECADDEERGRPRADDQAVANPVVDCNRGEVQSFAMEWTDA